MKIICYSIKSYNSEMDIDGTITRQEVVVNMEVPYNDENLEIAKSTSIDGEYVVVDDGQPEQPKPASPDDRIDILEKMINALIGVEE